MGSPEDEDRLPPEEEADEVYEDGEAYYDEYEPLDDEYDEYDEYGEYGEYGEYDEYDEEYPEEEEPLPPPEKKPGEKKRPWAYQQAVPAEEKPGKKSGKTPARKQKKRRGGLIALIVVAVLLLLLAGGVTAAAVAVGRLETIYPGITVDGIALDGMTREQAEQTLHAREAEYYRDFSVMLTLPMEHTLEITAEDAGLVLESAVGAENAWQYGREGGMYQNLLAYARSRWFGASADLGTLSTRSIDESRLHAIIGEVAAVVNEELLKSEMRVGRYSINIVKGAQALYIDEDRIVAVLADAILSADRTPIVYEVDMHPDNEMDLDALWEELTVEAVDATYDPSTQSVSESRLGVTFDLENAKRVWESAAYGETVAIPLEITEPETSAEELNNMLFRDLLGEKTTSLAGSSSNRIANIEKACGLIGTIVLQPGEEFDYNTTLGERTQANGWLTAPAYSSGTVVEEYGGGICQVSSTLFVSCLLSDLEITARSPHYFPVGYLTAGMDATVSWGGPEFGFRNSRELPIRIKAFVSEDKRTVTVQIWGTNVDGSWVDLCFSGAKNIYDDPNLVNSEGTPVATRCSATIWCYVKDAAGNILKGEGKDYHWFGSIYHYHDEDIQAKVNS